MKLKSLALPVLVSLLAAGSVSATTLNLRHEYISQQDKDADRIEISNRFHNGIGFSVEAKWGHENNRMLTDTYAKGHEVGISYQYKYSDKTSFYPAFKMDSGSSAVTYKAEVKGDHKFTKKFDMALRYRYGLKVYSDHTLEKGDQPYHQLNWTGHYKLSWGKVGFDMEFKKYPSNRKVWKGHDTDHLINFTGEYDKFKSGWKPFGEIGFVTGKSDNAQYKDRHDLRLRVGVKYNF